MKTKIAMLAAFLFSAIIGVHAQQGGMSRPTVEQRVKMTMDKLAPLNLTADEQTKTEAVFTDFYNQQTKMFEDARSSGTRPDREAFQKLTSDRDDKLKAIFTDDQYKKFTDEIEPTLRGRRGGNNQGGGQSSGTN
ncbi:MAG TPA: hypothetical protein VG847_01630 [Chitinophagaceae bacterium]|nr:hypothetical protein [Chitinophagaceae bacterium]